VRTRFPCPASRTTRSTWRCWSNGCAHTSRNRCSTTAAGSCPNWPPWHPKAGSGWEPHPGPTASRPSRWRFPDLAQYAVDPGQPGSTSIETTKPLGELFRDLYTGTEGNPRFRLFCPDETNSNRLGAVFEATDRCLMLPGNDGDDHVSADGRVMEVLSEHLCQGWLEGYLLTGRHGFFASYEAFAMSARP
jgi:phosphoketolase